MWKLEHIGRQRGNMLEWVKDFLKERRMRTVHGEGHHVVMERDNKWNAPGIGVSADVVSNIHTLHGERCQQLC